MVTLSPIVVGACCPFGLCRATCTTVPSCMFVLAPTLMAFTSPVRVPAGQGWCACLPGCKAPQRGHLPRKMAPYHTDEPLPSVTSPMMLAFGATKASGASVGRFPLYSCSVWCAATARTTPHMRGPE